MNFSKSTLIGVNIDLVFLDLTCDFFHCKQESYPFKYINLLMRDNPCLLSTWEPIVNLFFR